jgi:hypothetical protein
MVNKCKKKFSAFLAIKEMQVKITPRFHPIQSEWLLSRKQRAASAGEDIGGKKYHWWG